MKLKDVKRLITGDEVFWTDPDGGTCSRSVAIKTIKVTGNVVSIEEPDGSYLECYAKELS